MDHRDGAMKIRDLTKYQDEEGNIKLPQQIQAMLEYGFRWRNERENQQKFIDLIDDILDEKVRVFRSAQISPKRDPIPLIIITPSGISVVNPKSIEGVYQARDTSWAEMDNKGSLIPAKPNLIRETLLYMKTLQGYLKAHRYENLPIEGVLAFLSPGLHVDTKHPAVRILHSDAIRNFARQIAIGEPILDLRERETITDLIVDPHPPAHYIPPSRPEPEPDPPPEPSQLEQQLTDAGRKLNFSRRQWILLGMLVFAEILVLAAFIALVVIQNSSF